MTKIPTEVPSIYDFFNSNRYPTAHDAKGTVFTDVYDDVYGLGLAIDGQGFTNIV